MALFQACGATQATPAMHLCWLLRSSMDGSFSGVWCNAGYACNAPVLVVEKLHGWLFFLGVF